MPEERTELAYEEAQGWPEIVRTLHELGCSPGEIGAAMLALAGGATAREALDAMRAAAPLEVGIAEELQAELERARGRAALRSEVS